MTTLFSDSVTQISDINPYYRDPDINLNGEIVFWKNVSNNVYEDGLFYYDPKTGLVLELANIDGMTGSYARINDYGDVTWLNSTGTPLSYQLFTRNIDELENNQLTFSNTGAPAINNSNQIVCTMFDGHDDEIFLITYYEDTVPEPSTFILIISGLIGLLIKKIDKYIS